MTPSGIEPATFALVALCVNRLRHRMPLSVPLLRNSKSFISNFDPTCCLPETNVLLLPINTCFVSVYLITWVVNYTYM